MSQKLEVIKMEPPGGPEFPHPLLFIHGGMHCAACWQYYWLPYFAERGYSAYAMSLRGHGSSPGSYKEAHYPDYFADCQSVIEDLPSKPVLIGHSMGGFLVQNLVAKEDYPGAVLIASFAHNGIGLSTQSSPILPNIVPGLKAMITNDMIHFTKSPKLVRRLFFSKSTPEKTIQDCIATLTGEKYSICFGEMGTKDKRYHPDVSRVKSPILVLVGEDDYGYSPDDQKKIADAYGAQFEVISGPGAGHDLMMDLKWAEAADIMHQWLKGLDGV